MSNPIADSPTIHVDEQELANLMLLAAATYSYPPQQSPTCSYSPQEIPNGTQTQDAHPQKTRTRAPAPLPLKKQLSPTPSNSLLSPRQVNADNQTRRSSVQESPVDSDLLSPGGISLDETIHLRAGEEQEGAFELALCIKGLN
ncbi:hypothetical protein CSOJ01_06211 [Colletotrichum sojae]|uniref:Uncharacterized protein n=1 Tax=Colletotrichum sojae TaxID=2175907 RepID=A0A8H6JDL2_9PEZI|nr:hypothetical protein CSOJ01_06211 [Colletotrichum sojae]